MTKPAELTLADLPDLLTVPAAAKALRIHPETIRRAIRKEQLAATAPMGKIGKQLANTGYRIHKAELERWYFNLAHETKEAQS